MHLMPNFIEKDVISPCFRFSLVANSLDACRVKSAHLCAKQ